MNIRPMMRSPGHVPHLLPARRLGKPELRWDRFSYLSIAAFPETKRIYRKNIETLRHLEHSGWAASGLEGQKP